MLRAPDHGIISRTLCFQTQPPKGHPNQGMAAIEDACRPSRQLNGPVSAPHVLQFVNQRAPEVSFIPLACLIGQQDGGSPDAACYRPRDALVQQDLDLATNTAFAGQRLYQLAPLQPGEAVLPDSVEPSQINSKLREQQECSGEP